jgi:hypothetical protein
LLLVAVALAVAHIFYWADGLSYGPRYLYAALPSFLLLTARGVILASRWLGGRAGRLAVGVVLAALILGNLLVAMPFYRDSYQGYNGVDRSKVELVQAAAVTTPAVVFVDPGLDWWEYGSVFSSNTPCLDGPIIYARDLGAAANARLLTHFPNRHAYRLRNGRLQLLSALDPEVHAISVDRAFLRPRATRGC